MNRRHCMQHLGLAVSLPLTSALVVPGGAHAQAVSTLPPPEAQALGAGLRLQGYKRFRYWGFHVYDAHLWVRAGFEPRRYLQHPFVLSLTYAREIREADITERSIEEIDNQRPVSRDEAARWQRQLSQVLVDVQPGDRLSGAYTPPDQAAFFHNGRPTRSLTDAALVPLFFGIWLSPQTSQPRLRSALLRLDERDGDQNDA